MSGLVKCIPPSNFLESQVESLTSSSLSLSNSHFFPLLTYVSTGTSVINFSYATLTKPRLYCIIKVYNGTFLGNTWFLTSCGAHLFLYVPSFRSHPSLFLPRIFYISQVPKSWPSLSPSSVPFSVTLCLRLCRSLQAATPILSLNRTSISSR